MWGVWFSSLAILGRSDFDYSASHFRTFVCFSRKVVGYQLTIFNKAHKSAIIAGGGVAQLGEWLINTQQVAGSSPVSSTVPLSSWTPDLWE